MHRRSGGNPLFRVTLADTLELVAGEAADAAAIPDSLRGLLDTQLRSLHFAQREMLIAASAVGVEFSSLAVAAATGGTVDEALQYGWGSAMVRDASERVATIGERLPPSRERFFSLAVVFGYHATRCDVPAATRVAAHITRAAKDLEWPLAELAATAVNAIIESMRGDFQRADRNARIVRAAMPPKFRVPNYRDVLVPASTALAQNLCYLDRRAEAESVGREAIHRNGNAVFLGLVADLDIEAGDLAAAAEAFGAARRFCETTGSHCHLSEILRRTALVEERLGGGSGSRGRRPRSRFEEAERVARRQGCALVLRRLKEQR